MTSKYPASLFHSVNEPEKCVFFQPHTVHSENILGMSDNFENDARKCNRKVCFGQIFGQLVDITVVSGLKAYDP